MSSSPTSSQPNCPTPGCYNRTAKRKDGRAGRSATFYAHCSKCRGRQLKAKHPETKVLANLRGSAKRRGVPFNITLKEWRAWLEKTGYMEMRRGRTRWSKSIGRIDHSKGYSIANIQVEDYMFNSEKGHHVPDRPDLPQNHSEDYEDPF